MTGEEIIKFVEQVLIDDRIRPDYHLMLVNMAIRDVSRQAPYFDIQEIHFLANNPISDLPRGFKVMERFGNLKYISPSKIQDLNLLGEPSSYYYKGIGQVVLWPVPQEDKDYTILFRRGYDELTSLDESPQDIPDDYHDMLCYHIAWRTHDYFGNNLVTDQKSSLFQGEYFRMVAEFKQMVDSSFYEYDGELTTVDVLPRSNHWLSGGD